MGAGGSVGRKGEATTELIPMDRDMVVQVSTDLCSAPLVATITKKFASAPFLNVILVPFLKTLQKDPARKGTTLRMVGTVQVNGQTISLNHSGLSIHSPTGTILMQAGGSGSSEDDAVKVALTLHTDDDRAKPAYLLKRLGTILEPGCVQSRTRSNGRRALWCPSEAVAEHALRMS